MVVTVEMAVAAVMVTLLLECCANLLLRKSWSDFFLPSHMMVPWSMRAAVKHEYTPSSTTVQPHEKMGGRHNNSAYPGPETKLNSLQAYHVKPRNLAPATPQVGNSLHDRPSHHSGRKSSRYPGQTLNATPNVANYSKTHVFPLPSSSPSGVDTSRIRMELKNASVSVANHVARCLSV